MCLHVHFALGYPTVLGTIGTHSDNPMPFCLVTLGPSLFPHVLLRSFGSILIKLEQGKIQTRLWSDGQAICEIINARLVGIDSFFVT